MTEENYKNLKDFCLDHGADLFGVADIGAYSREIVIAEHLRASLTRAVCIGVRLSRSILAEISSGPTRLYFHHYRTVNDFLDQAALKAGYYIERRGFNAVPIPASHILDWEKMTAHLSHRKIGVLAGIGWIGRNNLLVNPEFGSRIRLVTVLTDMPLLPDAPVTGECGECRRCLEACPAGAIAESAADFDHRKCFEKLKTFQKRRMTDQYICGVCVNVCAGRL